MAEELPENAEISFCNYYQVDNLATDRNSHLKDSLADFIDNGFYLNEDKILIGQKTIKYQNYVDCHESRNEVFTKYADDDSDVDSDYHDVSSECDNESNGAFDEKLSNEIIDGNGHNFERRNDTSPSRLRNISNMEERKEVNKCINDEHHLVEALSEESKDEKVDPIKKSMSEQKKSFGFYEFDKEMNEIPNNKEIFCERFSGLPLQAQSGSSINIPLNYQEQITTFRDESKIEESRVFQNIQIDLSIILPNNLNGKNYKDLSSQCDFNEFNKKNYPESEHTIVNENLDKVPYGCLFMDSQCVPDKSLDKPLSRTLSKLPSDLDKFNHLSVEKQLSSIINNDFLNNMDTMQKTYFKEINNQDSQFFNEILNKSSQEMNGDAVFDMLQRHIHKTENLRKSLNSQNNVWLEKLANKLNDFKSFEMSETCDVSRAENAPVWARCAAPSLSRAENQSESNLNDDDILHLKSNCKTITNKEREISSDTHFLDELILIHEQMVDLESRFFELSSRYMTRLKRCCTNTSFDEAQQILMNYRERQKRLLKNSRRAHAQMMSKFIEASQNYELNDGKRAHAQMMPKLIEASQNYELNDGKRAHVQMVPKLIEASQNYELNDGKRAHAQIMSKLIEASQNYELNDGNNGPLHNSNSKQNKYENMHSLLIPENKNCKINEEISENINKQKNKKYIGKHEHNAFYTTEIDNSNFIDLSVDGNAQSLEDSGLVDGNSASYRDELENERSVDCFAIKDSKSKDGEFRDQKECSSIITAKKILSKSKQNGLLMKKMKEQEKKRLDNKLQEKLNLLNVDSI